MRILSAIISSIWNIVTFMDKEQRALVVHVLTVSQAYPKSFAFRNGAWCSDVMKVTYTQAQKNVNLSGVFYELGWRANAILAKHFAMLHICLHHEHIGRALSDIDNSENCIKTVDVINPVDNFKKADLANYFGSHVAITTLKILSRLNILAVNPLVHNGLQILTWHNGSVRLLM